MPAARRPMAVDAVAASERIVDDGYGHATIVGPDQRGGEVGATELVDLDGDAGAGPIDEAVQLGEGGLTRA